MKKTIKYFSAIIAVMSLVFLTGCGSKKSADKIYKNALKNAEKMESANIKYDVTASADMEGMNVAVTIKGNAETTKEGSHVKMNFDFLGQSMETEIYTIIKDDKVLTYIKDEKGKWSYSEEKNTAFDLANTKLDIKEIDKYGSIKTVKSDKKGYSKLELVYSKDDFNKLLSNDSIKNLLGNVKLDKDITIYAYVKDNNIRIINVDLSDVVNSLAGKALEGAKIKLVLNIELDDINKVKEIKVPSEVEKNAKKESSASLLESLDLGL